MSIRATPQQSIMECLPTAVEIADLRVVNKDLNFIQANIKRANDLASQAASSSDYAQLVSITDKFASLTKRAQDRSETLKEFSNDLNPLTQINDSSQFLDKVQILKSNLEQRTNDLSDQFTGIASSKYENYNNSINELSQSITSISSHQEFTEIYKNFESLLKGMGDRKVSTTMATVRLITSLLKDSNVGERIVPIVPDEARTFGMEGLFRQMGIYSSSGQLYEPEDSDKVMWYKEDIKGQVLQEGINEAGAISDWIAAATAYASHNVTMIPFYIYYSKFGFQRVGDLAWAAGDMQAKGFLMGGTAGRTTLAGEGLQHQDGDSLIVANTIPNCVSYDPTYAYELAVIIRDGMYRMYEKMENIFYYITLMNENYAHPQMPKGVEEGIIKGMYPLKTVGKSKIQVQLLGSGAILREVEKAADMLEKDWGVMSNVWSVTSFNEVTREAQNIDRQNLYSKTQKVPYVTQCLSKSKGPAIAATDYMKNYAEQIRKYVPMRYEVLGTDGFGRSDSRKELRYFFEVNADYITYATLSTLVDEGSLDAKILTKAAEKLNIDSGKSNPMHT